MRPLPFLWYVYNLFLDWFGNQRVTPSSLRLSAALSLSHCADFPMRPRSVLPPLFFSPLLLRALAAARPALPLALLPLAPAANIARKGEYVGNRTVGVVAHGSVAVGSAPCGKIPSGPRVVVGDRISRPLFLHLPQQ